MLGPAPRHHRFGPEPLFLNHADRTADYPPEGWIHQEGIQKMSEQQNNEQAWGSKDFERFLKAIGISDSGQAKSLVFAIDFAMRRNDREKAMDAALKLAELGEPERNATSEALRIITMYERLQEDPNAEGPADDTDDDDDDDNGNDGADNPRPGGGGAPGGNDDAPGDQPGGPGGGAPNGGDERDDDKIKKPGVSKQDLELCIEKMVLSLRDGLDKEAEEIALELADDMINAGQSKKSHEEIAATMMANARRKLAKEVAAEQQRRDEEEALKKREEDERLETMVELPSSIWNDPMFQRAAGDFTHATAQKDKQGQKKAVAEAVEAAQAALARAGLDFEIGQQQVVANLLPVADWPADLREAVEEAAAEAEDGSDDGTEAEQPQAQPAEAQPEAPARPAGDRLPAFVRNDPLFRRSAAHFLEARQTTDRARQRTAFDLVLRAVRQAVTIEGVEYDVRPNVVLATISDMPPANPAPAEAPPREMEMDTLRRGEAMFREMDQVEEPDFTDELEDISFLLASRDGKNAREAAEKLAAKMQRMGGKYAGWSAVDILKHVMKRDKDRAEHPSDSGTVIPIDEEDSTIAGDNEFGDENLRDSLARSVHWQTVSNLYGLDEAEADELQNIGMRLLKKGEDDSSAYKSAKDMLNRAKKKKKRNKLKNPFHLIKAIMDAIRKKKDGKKVTKPVKPKAEDGDQDKAA
jgi:hypothetical protein